ncbi:hypothetical protein [Chryseobacterium sp.]|uniref:hypothetical protein n=1 Tax=Chryseobacterium sp. TaxID=1871047 RepID=UPI0035C72BDB
MRFSRFLYLPFLAVFLLGCIKEKKADYSELIEVVDYSKDVVFDTLHVPEHLRSIVKQISEINVYQTKNIGKGAEKSANFENFKELKRLASDEELLALIHNKNRIVAVYSAIGLLDRKPEVLDKIFLNFLNLKSQIHIQDGCIIGDQNPAEPLYYAYLYSLDNENLRTDSKLQKLDSIIIFSSNSSESLLQEALRYKLYPKTFRKPIEIQAFKNHKISAINYLNHWYKGNYSNLLQKEYISIIKNDSFGYSKRKVLTELLSFKNPANKNVILDYLKKDTLLEDENEIIWKLNDNGILDGEYPLKKGY